MECSRESVLSHARLWAAIDALARRRGLTPSGLARKAGLDATAFNPSKRVGLDGRPRWPTVESLARVLDATGASLDEFVAVLNALDADPLPPVHSVPIAGKDSAQMPGFFDAGGRPSGPGWDRVPFPATPSEDLFALEIADAAFEPLYRAGAVILVAPGAEVRRGDRVLARHRRDGLIARTLRRLTALNLEWEPDNPAWARQVRRRDILWLGRIVWVSQ